MPLSGKTGEQGKWRRGTVVFSAFFMKPFPEAPALMKNKAEIWKAVHSRPIQARQAAAFPPGKTGAEAAVEPLMKLASDPAVIVRKAAVNALGLIGRKKTLFTFFRSLRHQTSMGLQKEPKKQL